MSKCKNPGCHHEDANEATEQGTFCSPPCIHEFQGWPDCAVHITPDYKSPSFDVWKDTPDNELCILHRKMKYSKGNSP